MSVRLMSTIITANTSNKAENLKRQQENADKYIKQLLECVQECQKRYGGKKELATEFDNCVASLCYTFELVFLHGLRTKPLTLPKQHQQTTTLKQVTEIVANSLNITNDNPSFWPFVEKHLTKHEQERYNVLKHIWTDCGRGRAWIRSALNERSLERYFHSIVNNIELLCIHYEDWALLRDQEKTNLLPTMAAGLVSILFAISIDKPELNCDIPNRSETIKSKIEPVIEAPPPEIREKKKRKIARQIISFDDDSASVTSIPSSNSSDNSSIKRIVEDSKMSEKIENSEIEEVETLTPVSYHAGEFNVGELTPIDVKACDSSNDDEDVLEVPTDISAVLTAVETKNNELLQRKQKRIDDLTKENENLKEQLQKYVSAVKMLSNDEETPNYQTEIKLYEKKLVQVAEMHGELMDFNVHLQQTLTQKDSQINRLKTELELLRGPMVSDDLANFEDDINSSGCVNVWIPQAFLTGTGSNSHHVYQIFLHAGNDEWNIYRRYAQFYALHNDLKKLDPEVATFDFPPKKSYGNKDSALVEERRKRLQVYLRRIINHWPELSHCNSRYLLEQHLAFFKDQRDDLKNKKSLFSPRRSGPSPTGSNHYTGL